MQDTEKFYPIKGYENYYEINKIGQIRRLRKSVMRISINGKIHQSNSKSFNKIIKGSITKSGYKRVQFRTGKNKSKMYLLHRLLAINFIPNVNNYPMINHIDGNKLNNDLSNLEWCTAKENNQHSYDMGLKMPNRHLTYDDAHNIRLEYKKWISFKKDFIFKMSKKYNVSTHVIHGIIFNKSYNNLNIKEK